MKCCIQARWLSLRLQFNGTILVRAPAEKGPAGGRVGIFASRLLEVFQVGAVCILGIFLSTTKQARAPLGDDEGSDHVHWSSNEGCAPCKTFKFVAAKVSAGLVGLAITYALRLTDTLNQALCALVVQDSNLLTVLADSCTAALLFVGEPRICRQDPGLATECIERSPERRWSRVFLNAAAQGDADGLGRARAELCDQR
jgi:hypothetical protein